MHWRYKVITSKLRSPFVLVILIGILIYIPTYFAGFLWDDEDFVYANTYVKEFQVDKFFTENVSAGRGKQSNYFRPIQLLVYSITHLFFGFNPVVFHIVNVLAHITAALSVYNFFQLLTKRRIIALPTALVFLVHPVQTEAVSYVSGLSDPLFVLFGFTALSFFLKRESGIRFYGASVLFFVLCLLSKESGLVFLPLLTFLLVIRYGWIKIVLILPYIFLTLLYLLYHFSVIQNVDMNSLWGETVYSASVLVRFATFINNLQLYIALLLFPKDLFMERDFTIHIQETFFTQWVVLFTFLHVLLVIYLYVKRNTSSSFSYLVFSFLSFYICFIPVSGIVLINGIFYEHFLYLPLVFFFSFWFLLFEKYLNKKALISLCVVGIVFVVRSVARQYEWADAVKLYEQTLTFVPGSVRVHNNLAMTLAERGRDEEAIVHFKKAIQIDPKIPNMYHNLGNLYRKKGDTNRSEEYYRQAISVSPGFSFPYASLLSLYKEAGNTEKYNEIYEMYKHQFQGE